MELAKDYIIVLNNVYRVYAAIIKFFTPIYRDFDDADLDAIFAYKSDLYYRFINDYLNTKTFPPRTGPFKEYYKRYRHRVKLDVIKSLIAALDMVLKKVPRFGAPLTVFRSIRDPLMCERVAKWDIGDIFVSNSFLSTTLTPAGAYFFPYTECAFVIHLPARYPFLYVADQQNIKRINFINDEMELLLPRKSRFRLIGKEKIKRQFKLVGQRASDIKGSSKYQWVYEFEALMPK